MFTSACILFFFCGSSNIFYNSSKILPIKQPIYCTCCVTENGLTFMRSKNTWMARLVHRTKPRRQLQNKIKILIIKHKNLKENRQVIRGRISIPTLKNIPIKHPHEMIYIQISLTSQLEMWEEWFSVFPIPQFPFPQGPSHSHSRNVHIWKTIPIPVLLPITHFHSLPFPFPPRHFV